jgi:hypothetical protein
VESVDHLFVTCRVASGVWYRVCRWLWWECVLPRNLQELLHGLVSLGSRHRDILEYTIVWQETAWSIQKARNDIIFSGTAFEVDILVDKIQFLYWNWLFAKHPSHYCSFYEWKVESILCWRK